MHLILTQARDPHADVVSDALRRQGASVVRFHPGDLAISGGLTIASMSDRSWCSLRVDGRRVDLDDVRAVWWRRPEWPKMPADLEPAVKQFARGEAARAVEALWHMLRDRFWVNPYERLVPAERKPYQLHVARAVGLTVPNTLITNRADDARHFFESCQAGMIYKTLDLSARTDDAGHRAGIFTSRVTASEMTARLAQIALAPCLFQEYLPKQSEIRVTVIGDRMFAAEIASADGGPLAVDWRREISRARVTACQLSMPLEQAIRELLRRMGLIFGCLDFVRTPSGALVFLEVNPSGQWYWVEQATGMPLLESFTRLLIDGPGRQA